MGQRRDMGSSRPEPMMSGDISNSGKLRGRKRNRMRQRRNKKLQPWPLPDLLPLSNAERRKSGSWKEEEREDRLPGGGVPSGAHCPPNKRFVYAAPTFSFTVHSQELGDPGVQNAGPSQGREGVRHLCGIFPFYGPQFRPS